MSESGRWRLFLDANVIFTAAHRPGGKASTLIELGQRGLWELTSSAYALEEASRNLEAKFPSAMAELNQISRRLQQVNAGAGMCPVPLPEKDQPILMAAIAAGATHLITGDLRDFGPFMNQPERTGSVIIQTLAAFFESLKS